MCINEASAQARAQSSNGRRVKGERVDLEPLVRFSFWRYVQDSFIQKCIHYKTTSLVTRLVIPSSYSNSLLAHY